MFYLLSLSLIIFSSSSPYSSRASPRRRRFHRGRNGREIQSGSECKRGRERCEAETRRPREKRGYPKRRRRRGPGIPEPGLDPRPSPPKSSTAARPQFRFVFSAPLLIPPFFLPPRFSLFLFISPSLFRPFLPDHGDNRPILCLLLLLLLRLLLLRPPMFLRRVLTGENCGKNVVDLRDPLRK